MRLYCNISTFSVPKTTNSLEKWKARGKQMALSFVRGKRGGGEGGILVCGPQQKERTTYILNT